MKLAQAVLLVSLVLPASALAETWTTGVVDKPLFDGSVIGYEAVIPPVLSADLTFQYGLWDSPDMTLDVSVNDVHAFTVIADTGYATPGPTFHTADVTDLLVEGENWIRVAASEGGEAVLGAFTIDYTPVPGPWLRVDGDCPGDVSMSLTGLSPAGSWALVSSGGLGSAVTPGGPCAGTVLGLAPATLALRHLGTADPAGTASLTPSLSAGACGAKVQAIDLETCEVSSPAGVTPPE
jgi:hypothetical protein